VKHSWTSLMQVMVTLTKRDPRDNPDDLFDAALLWLWRIVVALSSILRAIELCDTPMVIRYGEIRTLFVDVNRRRTM
jgi:hypothetical protein